MLHARTAEGIRQAPIRVDVRTGLPELRQMGAMASSLSRNGPVALGSADGAQLAGTEVW